MENLENSLPGSEGYIEAEQSSKKRNDTGDGVCLNCGTELKGPYCFQCGQKDIPRRQTIGDLLVNFVGSFTSFESKFFQSLKTLLFKPGRVTIDYNNGSREKYFHPARMYVFLSFIFFLILALIPDADKLTIKKNGRELNREEKQALLDSGKLNWGQESWLYGVPKSLHEYDSIQNTKSEHTRDGTLGQYFTRKLILLQQRSGENPMRFWQDYWRQMQDKTNVGGEGFTDPLSEIRIGSEMPTVGKPLSNSAATVLIPGWMHEHARHVLGTRFNLLEAP
jgi:hypothetical protein